MNTSPGNEMDARFDPDLVRNGDTRNVVDRYRTWTVEAIRNDLASRRTNLMVAIENWEHDFNIGSIVRTANAFNVAGVHIIGKRHWNRRGAMVTDRYIDVRHHDDVAAFVRAVQGHTIIAVDNLEQSIPLHTAVLPTNAVLVFGSEQSGLSDELVRAASFMAGIEQSGSTRSINAGAAAAIAMYEWQRQHAWHG